jgi:hypothetical protein
VCMQSDNDLVNRLQSTMADKICHANHKHKRTMHARVLSCPVAVRNKPITTSEDACIRSDHKYLCFQVGGSIFLPPSQCHYRHGHTEEAKDSAAHVCTVCVLSKSLTVSVSG